MPSLVVAALIHNTDSPFVWKCSECNAVFSLDRMTTQPTVTQVKKVTSDFEVHCKHEHPGEKVIGLQIKGRPEDVSQAAARVVKEATRD